MRPGNFTKHGIEENVAVIDLKQYRRMSEPGNPGKGILLPIETAWLQFLNRYGPARDFVTINKIAKGTKSKFLCYDGFLNVLKFPVSILRRLLNLLGAFPFALGSKLGREIEEEDATEKSYPAGNCKNQESHF
ncbi:MAG: hypothetical protein NTV54_13550 [Ignavibacteriales bacterium]|nr:hypothetical protein [Ignavibacteriales bacterium]